MQPVATTITPRFYETDALGHINNATITAWFEVARVRFLESLEQGEPDASKNWILASVKVDFLAETFYGSDVTAQIVAASAGNTSLTVEGEMYQNGGQTMRGTAVLVYMDTAAKKPTRVPDAIRVQLDQPDA